ncbi:AAA family ATPase [Moraxella canis]|uniref:AAA family ATPase n=1 Tax=Moraxella canis TaxID=90239 RepID=UPI0006685A06|nr:AAA family ATPase [Moraxella canis]
MKILSLELRNFRQFYGRQKIKFSTDPIKNITLIHAENGVGKTALLNAIKWCLFEETTTNFANKHKIINHEAESEGEYFYSVDIEFEEEGVKYFCSRGVDNFNRSFFKISKDYGYGYQPISDPSLFINTIIPKNMASYFFFQGEGVSSYARTTVGQNSTVRNAIHDILGFKIAKQSLDDLGEIKKEYRREIASRDKGGELGELNHKLSIVEQRESAIKKEINNCHDNIALYKKKSADISEKLENCDAAVVKENQAKRIQLEQQEKRLQQSLVSLEKKKKEFFGRFLNAIFAQRLTSEALDFINDEDFKGTIPAPYNENLVKDILSQATCICGASIHEGSQAYENIHKLLANAADPLQGDRVIRARETLKAIRTKRESINDIYEINNDIAEKQNQLEMIRADIEKIHLKMHEVNVENINQLEKDYQYYNRNLNEENRKLGRLEQEIISLEQDVKSLKVKINQLTAQTTGLETYQQSIAILEEVEKLLDTTLKEAEKSALLRLPMMINDTLGKYVRQDYKARLRKDNFNIELIDKQNRVVAESDGQQLLLSLTFIAALIRFARERKNAQGEILMPGATAPFIIDAPFGVLDNAYKGNMAKHIPESAEQVVFLLSSSHWEGTVEDNIRGRIGAEYNLVAEVSSSQGEKKLNPINICGKVFDTARYDCQRDRTVIEEIKL